MDSIVVDVFGPLFGTPAWQVTNFHGSMLMIEFGLPTVEIGEPTMRPTHLTGGPASALQRSANVLGEWTLTIEQCSWDLNMKGQRVADSESVEPTMSRALRVLRGQALSSVKVDRQGVTTEFAFDLGAVLLARTYQDSGDAEPDVMWTLRSPDGKVLAVRDDGTYSHAPGSSSPDRLVWQALAS